MKIAVIGANGRTGRIAVKDALARGHQVVAVTRADGVPTRDDDHLRNARADVRDPDALRRALVGADAVISAVGAGTSRAPTDVYSTGVSNALGAMQSNGAAKLALISAVPAGPWEEQPLFQRRIALPILQRFFGATYDDMRRMEAILQETTDVDWISLRPPRLVDKPSRGAYRLDTHPLGKARAITYGDLATALLDSLTRQDLPARCVRRQLVGGFAPPASGSHEAITVAASRRRPAGGRAWPPNEAVAPFDDRE